MTALVHYHDVHTRGKTMCGREYRYCTMYDGFDFDVVTCQQCRAAIEQRRGKMYKSRETPQERRLWRKVLGED